MKTIKVGDRLIGADQPCFVVAEIGINHNGDLDLAKRTIDAAVDAGADSVKFQNYRTEDFIFDDSLSHTYVSQGTEVTESQYEMFKRYELTQEMLAELKHHCDRHNIIFHSTPTSNDGIRDLMNLGVPLLKNGSDYLTHLPLIRSMGKTGLPTVLSTGMATLTEIDYAVQAFRDTDNDQLILLHCTSSYPTPPDEINLRCMPTLQAAFDCLVGFSDHSEGTAAAIGAATLGACWIEKHFTLDKKLPGPDHVFSSDPQEFKSLVSGVRNVEASLGSPYIIPTKSEKLGRRSYRLSCVAKHAIAPGQVITETDITFQRPGTGIPPYEAKFILGRPAKLAIPANTVIQMSDLG